MIYSGAPLAADIPDIDLASFTLARAKELGGKPALIDGPSGRALSYADLERSVRSLAAGLTARGFAKGDTFAIFMPNVPEYAVAFHGAVAAGGRCTTANPRYTARELGRQLADSRAKLLLTAPPFLDVARQAAAQAGNCEVFVLGEAAGVPSFCELLGDPGAAPEVAFDPANDIAAIPYSSGTTGLSKAVMLSHRNLVANMVQCQDLFALSPGDVVLAALPFFHQAGLAGIMNTGLRAGATIITMPGFEPGQFLDLLERYAVTRGHAVPPMALALARHPAIAGRDLSALRHITCGAAPLGAELEDELAQRMGCAVSQVYGLTEASLITHLAPPFGRAGKRGSVGPPVPGTECRLADPHTGAGAGPGERGEVWVRGPQVMRGYLNNPEATAAVIDGEGWLHTGDLGIADEDGWLDHRGPGQGADQVQGPAGRSRRAGGDLDDPPAGRRLRGDRRPRPAGRGSAEGVRGPGGRRLRRQGGPRLRRRAGSAVQAHPAHRAPARDPQVAIGEDPQAPAPLSGPPHRWAGFRQRVRSADTLAAFRC